jgi:hypothetical protein
MSVWGPLGGHIGPARKRGPDLVEARAWRGMATRSAATGTLPQEVTPIVYGPPRGHLTKNPAHAGTWGMQDREWQGPGHAAEQVTALAGARPGARNQPSPGREDGWTGAAPPRG